MDLKKLFIKEVAGKILPMESDRPKLGGKSKLAAGLALVAVIATALSQYFG